MPTRTVAKDTTVKISMEVEREGERGLREGERGRGEIDIFLIIQHA